MVASRDPGLLQKEFVDATLGAVQVSITFLIKHIDK
jgi:hypothetical protein